MIEISERYRRLGEITTTLTLHSTPQKQHKYVIDWHFSLVVKDSVQNMSQFQTTQSYYLLEVNVFFFCPSKQRYHMKFRNP